MTSDRILIVDRELKMVRLVCELLTGAGYVSQVVNKAEQAIQMTAKEQPALVILDVALGAEIDGFEIIRRIREFSDIPIIVLSSRGESEDILRGFAFGADDYVIKPFDPKILLARIRAVLKRCQNRVIEPADIVCNNLVINLAARRVTLDGVEIYLTETEYNLLFELARHRNQVLTHEHLLMAVWGIEFSNEVDYLRSYIHILRRKLQIDPSRPKLIISRSGVGYMLDTSQSNASGE